MSDDGTVIAQPAGARVLRLRASYLGICDNDPCEAHLLNALERWYAYKLALRDKARDQNKAAKRLKVEENADETLWIRCGANGWRAELLNMYSEKTILLRLNSLKARGFVLLRTDGYDRVPQWLFQREAVQAAVDAWAAAYHAPDLDPSEADFAPTPFGSRGKVHSEDLPNGVGNFTETNRNFYRDDSEDVPTLIRNTGINRNPTGIQQKTAAASAASVQEKSSEVGKAKKPEKPSSVQERPAPQKSRKTKTTSTEDVPGGPTFSQMFGAVATACYGGADALTTVAKGRTGKTARSLLTAGYHPDEIQEIFDWIKRRDSWRSDIGPETLEGEAPKWRASQKKAIPAKPAQAQVSAAGDMYDPRADASNPAYDPRFDPDAPEFDPDYVLKYA